MGQELKSKSQLHICFQFFQLCFLRVFVIRFKLDLSDFCQMGNLR